MKKSKQRPCFTDKLPSHIPLYTGPITVATKNKPVPFLVDKAYQIHRGQIKRCFDKNNPSYKHYGGKNILVRYDSRTFVSWFIFSMKSYRGDINQSAVGRLDHAKDYTLDNIEIQSIADNSREVCIRNGLKIADFKKQPISMHCRHCDAEIRKFLMIKDAAEFNGLSIAYVSGMLRRKRLGKWLTFYFKFVV